MKEIEKLCEDATKWVAKNLLREDVLSFQKLKDWEKVRRTRSMLRIARLLDNVKVRFKDAWKAEELREQGNELYNSEEVAEAIKCYTESLFTAPLDSPEYYLALVDRSLAFFYLKDFSLSIEDAESALSLLKDERPDLEPKRKQLTERILECRELAKDTESTIDKQGIKSYFEMRDNQNLKIPCASENIVLDRDETYNRKVVAAVDMQPGNVIVIERPYSHILQPGERFSRCAYCLRKNVALKPCPGCVDTGFCSEKCRTLAEWHKYECPFVDRLIDMKHTNLELLNLRIICQARCDFSDWKQLQNVCKVEESKLQGIDISFDGTYGSVHRLDTNENLRTHEDMFERCVSAAVFLYLLKSETTFFDDWKEAEAENLVASLLLHHIMTVPTNGHNVSQLYSKNIGFGLFPFLSMFNHSCCPNIYVQDIGIVKVAIILRSVKKGDQLFDSYGPHHAMSTKLNRRKKLLKQYKFVCRCEACTDDWPTYRLMADGIIDIKYFLLRGINYIRIMKCFPQMYATAASLESFGPSNQIVTVQEYIKQGLSILASHIKSEDLN